MNILMYSNNFGKPTQTFIKQDVEHLLKKHNLLYICNTIVDSGTVSHENIKIIKAYPMNLFQRALWKFDIRLNYSNKYFKQHLDYVLDEFKPDLIHCQFGFEALRLIDNLSNGSIPVVIQFRGSDSSKMLRKKSYIKRLKEILDRDNYYSVFVAGSLRKNLKNHDINVNKSMILNSGIDLTKFSREKDIVHHDFIFLQVSSLVEKKGHEYTLKAFAKFLSTQKSKNFKLIITGDGDRKALLVDLAEKLAIQDYVNFIGFVPPTKAKELMQNADVFVHHSITTQDGNQEGIPNAIMEAMAMELPVLSTYHAGISELVTDGINGYLVQEKDINTYALRMVDILSWGRKKINRNVIGEKFEIGKHIEKLEGFYLKMINK